MNGGEPPVMNSVTGSGWVSPTMFCTYMRVNLKQQGMVLPIDPLITEFRLTELLFTCGLTYIQIGLSKLCSDGVLVIGCAGNENGCQVLVGNVCSNSKRSL
jgi:hypothetical protein